MTYLLFHSHLHHQDLHSFPTRRSSDLNGKSAEDSQECRTRVHIGEQHFRRRAARVHLPAICWRSFTMLPTARVMKLLTDEAETLDRKSTRLNSSHVAISYAVFCLKKKK